jgi:DnaJ-class molecular chaperone
MKLSEITNEQELVAGAPVCTSCNGSGKGKKPKTTCQACHGVGILPNDDSNNSPELEVNYNN